jgi:hypothetical protein
MGKIKSAPFSFVRFEHPADNDHSLDIPYSLPAIGNHNLAFQFIVDVNREIVDAIKLAIARTDGTVKEIFDPVINATPLNYKYSLAGIEYPFNLTGISVNGVGKAYTDPIEGIAVDAEKFAEILYNDFGIELQEDFFVLSEDVPVIITGNRAGNEIAFPYLSSSKWYQGRIAVSGLAMMETECFSYALLDAGTDEVLGYSNPFQPIIEEEDQAYTSMVTYSCYESALSFIYPGDNIIRLPFYLLKPQFPKKSTVYQQSSGRSKVLSASITKDYELITEHMP